MNLGGIGTPDSWPPGRATPERLILIMLMFLRLSKKTLQMPAVPMIAISRRYLRAKLSLRPAGGQARGFCHGAEGREELVV